MGLHPYGGLCLESGVCLIPEIDPPRQAFDFGRYRRYICCSEQNVKEGEATMNVVPSEDRQEVKGKFPGQVSKKAVLRFGVYVILGPAVLFLAAGRLNWLMGWVYVGTLSTHNRRAIAWCRASGNAS